MKQSRHVKQSDLPGELVRGTIAEAADLRFTQEEAEEFREAVRAVRELEDIPEDEINAITLR